MYPKSQYEEGGDVHSATLLEFLPSTDANWTAAKVAATHRRTREAALRLFPNSALAADSSSWILVVA